MDSAERKPESPEAPAVNELVIQVVHDNNAYAESLRTAWGFAALVTGPEKTILFDTGSDGTLLRENLAKLGIDPRRIEVVVLSHVHGDHTGGLTGLLQENPRVSVWLPESFPARFKDVVRGYGATVVEVREPQEICRGVHTTGLLGRRIEEQALVIRTGRGAVVLTGCAHPGIGTIVARAHRLHEGDLLLVMGGFHLEWAFRWQVQRLINTFQSHNVQYVAPTHCTGDRARQWFQQHYGAHYIEVGVGKTVTFADLM
jgi:7,8-dihydropterin-6-yl-methyl-4-(beta-D-ribofuranosyl)aminobenzene 5'-phosphate synthase